MINILTRCNQLRWSQSNELEDLQHSPRSLVSRSRVDWPEGQENVTHWIPLVNISEDPEDLIKVELPQVKKRDVKLTMEGGTLTITGDRKFKKNSKKNHRVERTYGSFMHSFSLPDDATHPEVTAEFIEGLLTLHLAKNEKATPQQVKVATTAYDQIPHYHNCSSGWGINE